MKSFVYRLSGLLLKFICPLVILYRLDSTELGKYYLATTFLTFSAMLVGLEMASANSALYLKESEANNKNIVFSTFVYNQLIISLVLSIFPAVVCWYLTDLPMKLIVLIPFLIAIESCSTEIGRFLWNIGRVDLASRRDFYRAVAITLSVVLSILINSSVISLLVINLIILTNALIILSDINLLGGKKLISIRKYIIKIRNEFYNNLFNILKSVKQSSPQLIHLQVLSLQPLLERYLMGNVLGLSIVGYYGFYGSLVQTGGSLFSMPYVAKVRQLIFSNASREFKILKYEAAYKLIKILAIITIVFIFLAYYSVPILSVIMRRDIKSNLLLAIVAGISGFIQTYSSALAPLYASLGRIFIANLVTLICMIPILIIMALPYNYTYEFSSLVYFSIVMTSFFQLVVRIFYLKENINNINGLKK